jgi:D-serine deaminase-like pyridoxal phosphate-dependent protein
MTGALSDPVERDTPLLRIDIDAVERNIRRLQAHCDRWGLACRPHVKTHKLPPIARIQRSHGAVGITCQKLGEATAMIDAGMDDVLLAFPIVGEDKLRRLARVARRANLGVVGDDAPTVSAMAAALAAEGATAQFFVECDTGLARTGVQSPEDAAALAAHAAGLDSLIFRGLMTYPTPNDGGRWLGAARAACEARGLVVSVVSGGGTADAFATTAADGLTELRAGTYVYGDRACIANGSVSPADCALRIRATVVSRPTPGRAILDAGSKALTTDPVEAPGSAGYGLVVGHPEAVIYELSEEHGHVDVSRCRHGFAIGDLVEIIPNHACGATNLYDTALAYSGGRLMAEWAITARGRSR